MENLVKTETCKTCGEEITDVKSYRKYECRKCWNYKNKMAKRKQASTLEGYFSMILYDVNNHPHRNRFENDIDLNHLMNLYKLQNGRCAISNIEMTWGYGDDINGNRYRKPYNISVERLNNSKGYMKDNVILICNAINLFKSTNDVSFVYEISKEIANHENRLTNIIERIQTELLN